MKFSESSFTDVVIIDPVVFEDTRGFRVETCQAERFGDAGINAVVVQDIHSVQDAHNKSCKGIARGFHYQLKKPQGKLIRAVAGRLFDVAVDLRRSSPTIGQWVGVTLSAVNRRIAWISPGFVHGFMVPGDHAKIGYRMTDFHAPDDAHPVLWEDPDLGVRRSVAVVGELILSESDLGGVSFRYAECYA